MTRLIIKVSVSQVFENSCTFFKYQKFISKSFVCYQSSTANSPLILKAKYQSSYSATFCNKECSRNFNDLFIRYSTLQISHGTCDGTRHLQHTTVVPVMSNLYILLNVILYNSPQRAFSL